MADTSSNAEYWDSIAECYQSETRISTDDFHYGPLLPGDRELQLLPTDVSGLSCLEIGSGAGQNSIYLTKRGAICTALDASSRQIEYGRALAAEENVDVRFEVADMDEIDPADRDAFDLIHSTYALPFSRNPANVIAVCAKILKPGGVLILTVGHPLYSGEWLDIDNDSGLLLKDYFHLETDIREEDDSSRGHSVYWPLSTVAEWIASAGLSIDRLLEPRPCPIPELSEEEIRERVPYDSTEWRTLYEVISRIPIVAVFKCTGI